MTAEAMATAGPLRLMRLVLRFNLHPEAGLHPSWLPPDWPAHARARLARLAPAAQALLREVLARTGVVETQAADYAFDSPVKRLLLLDASSLRRLAFYASLCAHAPLMRPRRNALATALRRQARRIDADAVEFVLDRAPQLTELHMSAHSMKDRPAGCGRLVADRGYRLLMAVVADEGEAAARRLARMLPRRVSALPVPELGPRQKQQLRELMLACIVPEKARAMGLAFLISTDNLQLLSERKVFKEAEYAALLDAAAVLDAAHGEAARMAEQAGREAALALERGRAEGLRRAQAEYAQRLAADALATQRQLQALREAMGQIVVRAVAQFMGEVDPAQLLESALRRVDALLRAEPFVALRVAPAQEPAVRRALAALGQDAGWALEAAVVADPALADGACVVSTASGTLEIGLEAQLEAFRRAVASGGSAS